MRSTAESGSDDGPQRQHGRSRPTARPGESVRGRSDVVVPLVDEQEGMRIYDPSLHRFALIGGSVGAVGIGAVGWSLADGALAIAGLGQFAASGVSPATVAAATVGLAAGALAGALIALFRIPPRRRS